MNIHNYATLIQHLPVRQQSETTKRSTWRKAESEIDWLPDFNNKLFDNKVTLTLSRQEIIDTTSSIREFILKTIYWGYPSDMRGNHFVNILQKIQTLETTLSNIKRKENLTTTDFNDLTKTFKSIPGLGLSTYSKLLHFLDIKFNGNPCLILDQRIIDVFANSSYYDFSQFGQITYDNAATKYLEYLETTNKLAKELHTQPENIELFLFLFGNKLKTVEAEKEIISQMWNGYCPESMLKGKKVRMRLNDWDFFESEETRLQICVLSGVQAIILNFRGKGEFRSTPNFADEIENGEILSPQNTDSPPFNDPTVVFQNSEEIEKYIRAIK